MSISALVAVIGSVLGALYGGFLMYQKVEQAIEFVEQQQEYEEKIAAYKQTYDKYEAGFLEVQEELGKVESRPTVEAYEQVLFEKSLLILFSLAVTLNLLT